MLAAPTYKAPNTGFAGQQTAPGAPRTGPPVGGAQNNTGNQGAAQQQPGGAFSPQYGGTPAVNPPYAPPANTPVPQTYGTPMTNGQGGTVTPVTNIGVTNDITNPQQSPFPNTPPGAPLNSIQAPGLTPWGPYESGVRGGIVRDLFGGQVPTDPNMLYMIDQIAAMPPQQQQAVLASLRENLPDFQAAAPIASAGLGLDIAQLDIDRERIQQQGGYLGQDYARGLSDLGLSTENAMAALGLDREALGLTRQGHQQDASYANQMRALAGQLFGNQMGQYDLTDESNTRNNATAFREARADATSRGAYITQGFRDDKSDLTANLDEQMRGTDFGREGARIGRDQSYAGYDRQLQQASRGLAQVGIDARRYNLTEDQLQQGLMQGMRNLGIDYSRGLDAINNNLQDNDQGRLGATQNAVTFLLEAAGVLDMS